MRRENGWPIVAAVAWREPNARDRVLVLLFSARIFIEEEERLSWVWTAVASANRLMRSTGLFAYGIPTLTDSAKNRNGKFWAPIASLPHRPFHNGEPFVRAI